MSRFHYLEIWRLNSPKLNPLDYYIWGNVRGLSRAPSNTKTRRYRRIQGNASDDSLSQGTIDRAVKEFLKQLNVCVVAKGGHFCYSQ